MITVIQTSCHREEQYPITPAIQFVSLNKIDDGTGVDSKATLTFSFQDGDGDIGLDNTSSDLHPPFDTSSIYYYNLYIDYFEKQNGTFQKIDLELEQHARIPRLSEVDAESIQGEIDIDLLINNPLSPYDTIMFEFFIYDRAKHKSNIESTPEIIVKKR